MSDDLAELEARLRRAEERHGVLDPVPDDPTDLPLTANEYYMRNLENIGEDDPPNPHAWDRYQALSEANATPSAGGR